VLPTPVVLPAEIELPEEQLNTSGEIETALEQISGTLRTGLEEIQETLRKNTRAQQKSTLRIEDIEKQLAELTARMAPVPLPGMDRAPWHELFDAMDVLAQAREGLQPGVHGALRDGLGGISERIDRFLRHQGFERLDVLGKQPDGTLMRVVGTEESAEHVDGTVFRVVRAPIRASGRTVREGEVITVRNKS
jgi:hypothetical protein